MLNALFTSCFNANSCSEVLFLYYPPVQNENFLHSSVLSILSQHSFLPSFLLSFSFPSFLVHSFTPFSTSSFLRFFLLSQYFLPSFLLFWCFLLWFSALFLSFFFNSPLPPSFFSLCPSSIRGPFFQLSCPVMASSAEPPSFSGSRNPVQTANPI